MSEKTYTLIERCGKCQTELARNVGVPESVRAVLIGAHTDIRSTTTLEWIDEPATTESQETLNRR